MGLTCKAPITNGGPEGNEIPVLADRPIGWRQWGDDLFTAAAAALVDNRPVTVADIKNPFL